MASRFDDLVARSRERAQAEPGWVGSDEHLALLRDSLEPVFGVAGASLAWASPDRPAAGDPQATEIRVRRPEGTEGGSPEAAEAAAVALLHECIHARYSTSVRHLSAYRLRRRALPAALRQVADRLFHILEDSRVIPLALADEPALEPVLAKIAANGVAALTAAADTVESGEGTSPKSEQVQAEFALEVYAIDPTRELALHPSVADFVDSMKKTVDRTRSGTTGRCGLASVKLALAIGRSKLESH